MLFLTAVKFTSVIDVFLGIEMADAGTHRIKIANICRFCGKTASSKKTSARPKEKFKLEFERYGVNVENDNDLIHPPNVCLTCVGYETVTFQSSLRENPNYLGAHKDSECICTKDGRGRPSKKRKPVDVEDGSDTESGEDNEDEAENNMFRQHVSQHFRESTSSGQRTGTSVM